MNVCAARPQILNGPQFATLFHEIGRLHDLETWLGQKLDRRKGLGNCTRQDVALGIAGYGKFCRTQFSLGESHCDLGVLNHLQEIPPSRQQ
jgi:hypothetical protein